MGDDRTAGYALSELVVNLLGPFEVRLGAEPVTRFQYAKVRALLAYLAVEGQQPHTRASLAALLWPDQPERTARASLSQALTTLRKALGSSGDPAPLLLTDSETVQLDPQRLVQVDAAHFLALLTACERHAHYSWRTCTPCASRLRQAVALYRGDFLADFFLPDSAAFEEWAALQREHRRQRALSALERLADWAEWRGWYGEAIESVRRQVALEPLVEANQRRLMRLLALNGEAGAALMQYRQLETMLAQDLNTKPEAATLALAQQLRRADLSGLRRAPAFVAPDPPTPLVGRAGDLETVVGLFEAGGRNVALTGTAGVGKTRLALEVAHRLRYAFDDGVYLVELAPVAEAVQVAGALAGALGLPLRGGQSAAETLRGYLRSRHLLLVLDNFEHVLHAAPLIADLLEACPALHVLVTSRERLNLRIEHQVPLAPLPDDEAVRLFRARVRAAGAAPATPADEAAQIEICRRLDGLPLAI
jgi:DNA-binding SARP family transcriptional activator